LKTQNRASSALATFLQYLCTVLYQLTQSYFLESRSSAPHNGVVRKILYGALGTVEVLSQGWMVLQVLDRGERRTSREGEPMKLLPRDQLLQTSRVDHADWNYRPFLAQVMRRRFALVLDLLPPVHTTRLLEIGFGSGVFMPELALHCQELYGIDVHSHVAAVQKRLDLYGVSATLSQQDAANTCFADGFFDAIISISAIEFVEDIERTVTEFARILIPDGVLIVVAPNQLPLLDFALRVVTGESAKRDYGDRRARVLPELLKHFHIDCTRRLVPVYTAYRLRKAT
jgi:ubiquinone/menaquinone biosynthesis C-methylase UbiE